MNDWTDQFDNCEPCEFCGNLVKEGRKFARLSLAVTELYTFGVLSARDRDIARKRLKGLAGKATVNE